MAIRKRDIPNALTIARLIGAAVFILILSLPWGQTQPGLLTAFAIFILSAITDALDGFLARKWHVVSAFGRIADPLADKILVLGAFVMLAGPQFVETTDAGTVSLSGVAPWMAVLVLSRELMVTSIRGYYESRGIDFSAGFSGKLKMVIQSIAIPLILLAVAFDGRTVAVISAWATVVVTVWSALPYLTRAINAERSVSSQDG